MLRPKLTNRWFGVVATVLGSGLLLAVETWIEGRRDLSPFDLRVMTLFLAVSIPACFGLVIGLVGVYFAERGRE